MLAAASPCPDYCNKEQAHQGPGISTQSQAHFECFLANSSFFLSASLKNFSMADSAEPGTDLVPRAIPDETLAHGQAAHATHPADHDNLASQDPLQHCFGV